VTKIVLTFGLISGAIISGMFLLTLPFVHEVGTLGEVVGYASMLAASLLIYFGIRSYRDNVGGGSVGFGRAFSVGILIVAVSSVLYVATWEVFYPRYMPDFYEKYAASAIASARTKGATDEQVAEIRKRVEMYRNPVLNSALTFLEPLPVGLIMSLLFAWSLSRRRRGTVSVPAT